jgi:hypothetical protein
VVGEVEDVLRARSFDQPRRTPVQRASLGIVEPLESALPHHVVDERESVSPLGGPDQAGPSSLLHHRIDVFLVELRERGALLHRHMPAQHGSRREEPECLVGQPLESAGDEARRLAGRGERGERVEIHLPSLRSRAERSRLDHPAEYGRDEERPPVGELCDDRVRDVGHPPTHRRREIPRLLDAERGKDDGGRVRPPLCRVILGWLSGTERGDDAHEPLRRRRVQRPRSDHAE